MFYCFLLIVLNTACKNSNTDDSNRINIAVENSETTLSESDTLTKTILFFGDSLTAGYGLDDPDDAFPGLIQDRIDSLGLNYEVVNAGISGETTTGGKNRLDWVLETDASIFVLELGANDGLRGVPVSETKANLQSIIDTVKSKIPGVKIVLAGMQLPPNLGIQYTSDFKAMFQDLAKENNIELIPFLLKDVGGIPKLNQADGIHPTTEGHKIVAKTVFGILEPLLMETTNN